MPDATEKTGQKEANRPRESISWFEAVAFCRWFSRQQGVEIRLPIEQSPLMIGHLNDVFTHND